MWENKKQGPAHFKIHSDLFSWRDSIELFYVISAFGERTLKTCDVCLDANASQLLNGYFLQNEHRNLYFLASCFNLSMTLFTSKIFAKKIEERKMS